MGALGQPIIGQIMMGQLYVPGGVMRYRGIFAANQAQYFLFTGIGCIGDPGTENIFQERITFGRFGGTRGDGVLIALILLLNQLIDGNDTYLVGRKMTLIEIANQGGDM